MRPIITTAMLLFLFACATNPGSTKKEEKAFMQWSLVQDLIESGSVVKIYELNSTYLTLKTSSDKFIDFIPPSIDEVNKALFLAPNKENITWYHQ